MKKLKYNKLEMQSYLKKTNLCPLDAKMTFAFRVRMANFSENFRGLNGQKTCPLCKTHLDNQQMAFQCPEISPKLNKLGTYESIFLSEIPTRTIQNLKEITKLREDNMKELN